MRVASIDVGYKGGIAIWEVNRDDYKLIALYPMPVKYEIKRKKRRGKYTNIKVPNLDIVEILHILKDIDKIIIENVHSLPKEGVVSAFRFGFQKGVLVGVAMALVNKDNVELITPQKWKKGLGLGREKIKTINYVNGKFNLSLNKNEDGLADAVAIGDYYITRTLFGGK